MGAARRWLFILFAAVVLVGGCAAAGAHLIDVHHRYGVWAWSPPAKTATITFRGRTYLLGDHGSTADLAGFPQIGEAPADGQIFGPSPRPGMTVTGLWVRYPDGEIVSYGLSGGP